jgi:hypothetical protein
MLAWLRKYMRPKALTKTDLVIDNAIAVGKKLGCKTPREAAELINRQPLSDEAWAEIAYKWYRRWY